MEDGSYGFDAAPVRTLVSGRAHPPGKAFLSWDGKDDSETAVVADGLYGVTVFAMDGRKNVRSKWVAVEVDRTVRLAVIDSPEPGDPIGSVIEVKGTADGNGQGGE